jgi:hypothetical protein
MDSTTDLQRNRVGGGHSAFKGGFNMDMDSKADAQIGLRIELQPDSDSDSDTRSPPPPPPRGERRRDLRFSLGLVVNVHLVGRPDPVIVEMIDIGAKGARFRSADPARRAFVDPVGPTSGATSAATSAATPARQITLNLDQQAAFGFVVPGQHVCVATGKVTRIAPAPHQTPHLPQTEFVLSIERANDAFHGFLVSLAH